MRKSGRLLIWPPYFESSQSRGKTRRVRRELALRDVSIKEISDALRDLGISAIVEANAAHPSQPWRRTGAVSVDKSQNKSLLLRLVAEKMRENRSLGKED